MKQPGHELLCEACGYALRGLAPSAACPECGRAIARSLHTSRPGTAWQVRPGVLSWLRTGVQTLLSPREVFSTIRFDVPRARGQLALSLCVGTCLLLTPGVLAWTLGAPQATIRTGPTTFQVVSSLGVASLILALAPAAVFGWSYALTPRAYRARGWRVTRSVYLSIAAHASFAWIIAGTLMILSSVGERLIMDAARGMPDPRTALRLASAASSIGNLGLLAGAGVLIWLEYTGLRINRFVNPPELFPPEGQPHPRRLEPDSNGPPRHS